MSGKLVRRGLVDGAGTASSMVLGMAWGPGCLGPPWAPSLPPGWFWKLLMSLHLDFSSLKGGDDNNPFSYGCR